MSETKLNPVKIVGAQGKRRELDFYPTPPDVTQALVDSGVGPLWGDHVWEPACGGGAIASVLLQNGISVTATDIQGGVDFLSAPLPEAESVTGDRWIVTNPHFCLAPQFIERAFLHLKENGVKFAFLLKAQFWNSKKRYELFRRCRPSRVLPLTWRPDFTGQGASLMDCMWCVWREVEPWHTEFYPLERPKKE